MTPALIFWPVLGHMLLVMILYVILAVRKARVRHSAEVDLAVTALNSKAWTPEVVQVSNNIDNQFALPVLFYGLCGLLFVTESVSTFSLAIACAFLLSRVAHSAVHIGRNHVPHRLMLFSIGALCIMILLVCAGIGVYQATVV